MLRRHLVVRYFKPCRNEHLASEVRSIHKCRTGETTVRRDLNALNPVPTTRVCPPRAVDKSIVYYHRLVRRKEDCGRDRHGLNRETGRVRHIVLTRRLSILVSVAAFSNISTYLSFLMIEVKILLTLNWTHRGLSEDIKPDHPLARAGANVSAHLITRTYVSPNNQAGRASRLKTDTNNHPQRRSMRLWQRLAIHLIRENDLVELDLGVRD